jgi:hypothetical protein
MCGLFDMRAIPTIAKTLSAALFVTGGCARAPKREPDPGAVRAAILALENQWATAIERQDAAAFERLAAEDFRFIEDDGRVLNRTQYIVARSHNPENVESAVQDEIEVRQYGDAAISDGPLDHSWDAGRSAFHVPPSMDGRIHTTGRPMASGLRSTHCFAAVIPKAGLRTLLKCSTFRNAWQ